MDYTRVAEVLAEHISDHNPGSVKVEVALVAVAFGLAAAFYEADPRFDPDRFLDQAGVHPYYRESRLARIAGQE